MAEALGMQPAPRVWPVGALCRAIADALEARFNPVRVSGEITGFTRAASGHCYFSIKDAQGMLRCAMFRRAASQLDFVPRDGENVEVSGRLGVYEPRGELQLVVQTMARAGLGSLFEQFLQRKARLEALGLFDAARKRPLPTMPRGIGLVTSLAAAALHDVLTALQRRVPHIPVWIAPASVQGEQAPRELIAALQTLYARGPEVEVILLVRGGGALEDLWAFNDEQLVHTLAQSPVPIISGVGHETDFTLADFVADLRAPTPTAAAELVCDSKASCEAALAALQLRLVRALAHAHDRHAQRLDHWAARMGRPSGVLARQRAGLDACHQRLLQALRSDGLRRHQALANIQQQLPRAVQQRLQRAQDGLDRLALRLQSVDPSQVLQRGYAWLTQPDGTPVTGVAQVEAGQALRATLADGTVDLRVQHARPN